MAPASEERVAALIEMVRGATLLKAGRSGKPHFRQFSLNPELTRIRWESPKKDEASVGISEITELVRGQTTRVFIQNPIPEHQELSFSLAYGAGRTLDLVCKDKREYDVWIRGIQALTNREVSAEEATRIRKEAASGGGNKVRVVIEKNTAKLVVREDASDVYTWGNGRLGRLGHGDDSDESTPRVLEALLGKDVVMMACGAAHSMAITERGEVYGWGNGAHGRLGNGHERNRFTPLAIAALRGKYVTQLACGDGHTAALSESGLLYTWGNGESGQLGFDVVKTSEPTAVPLEAFEGRRPVQVACGPDFTIVVADDGALFSFGSNSHGQLGLGDYTNRCTPERIMTLQGVEIRRVACGGAHVAALAASGVLYVWGDGASGQLGFGDELLAPQPAPRMVDALSSHEAADVSCGQRHTMVLLSNGLLYGFGDGSVGQLGLGTAVKFIPTPRQVMFPEKQRISMIACGDLHSAAVTENGQLFTWGHAANGRLGQEGTRDRLAPVAVEAVANKSVRMVVCGGSHMAVTVTHAWVPDKEARDCMACKKRFTQIRRRHHCRKCGGVFCGDCSSKRFPILEAGFSEPVRVCDKCYSILSR